MWIQTWDLDLSCEISFNFRNIGREMRQLIFFYIVCFFALHGRKFGPQIRNISSSRIYKAFTESNKYSDKIHQWFGMFFNSRCSYALRKTSQKLIGINNAWNLKVLWICVDTISNLFDRISVQSISCFLSHTALTTFSLLQISETPPTNQMRPVILTPFIECRVVHGARYVQSISVMNEQATTHERHGASTVGHTSTNVRQLKPGYA